MHEWNFNAVLTVHLTDASSPSLPLLVLTVHLYVMIIRDKEWHCACVGLCLSFCDRLCACAWVCVLVGTCACVHARVRARLTDAHVWYLQAFLSVLSRISVLLRVVVPLCTWSAHTGHPPCDEELGMCKHVGGIVTCLCSVSCAMENQARANSARRF